MKKFNKKDLPQSIKNYIEANSIIHVDNVGDDIDQWSKGRIRDMQFNRYIHYTLAGFTNKYIIIPADEKLWESFSKALKLHKKAVLEHTKQYPYDENNPFDGVLQQKRLYASYVNMGISLIECFIQAILIEPLLDGLYRDLPYPSKIVDGWKSVEDYATLQEFDDWLISINGETCKNQWGYERIYIHDFWLNDVPRQLQQDLDELLKKKFGY